MKQIEIIAVYHSRDSRPTYVLAAAWDQVTHYFTDYLCADRATYDLPDGYDVYQDQFLTPHIYPVGEDYPCELFRHSSGLPAFAGKGFKTVVLHPAKEEAE